MSVANETHEANGTVKVPPYLTEPFRIALGVVVAAVQANPKRKHQHEVIGRANAVLIEGRLFPTRDGLRALVPGKDADGLRDDYHVRHACDCDRHTADEACRWCNCPSSTMRPGERCKHWYALELYRVVTQRVAE